MSLVNTFAAWGVSQTLAAQVSSILRKYGADAHVYLPGIGVINGLTAGNYLDSAGATPASVDNPVGLVLDASGSVGSELVTNGDFSNGTTGWTKVFTGTIEATNNTLKITNNDGTGTDQTKAYTTISTIAGKTYKLSYSLLSVSVAFGGILVRDGANSESGTVIINTLSLTPSNGQYIFTAVSSSTTVQLRLSANTAFAYSIWDNISVKEVTGIHATQATTANKGILRQTSGKYNWVFDATDLLTATYPAGHESVTIIDSKSTGQETTSAVNIVGSYSMGPSVTLYGRFIFKTITASELAVIQSYCNRLAGV